MDATIDHSFLIETPLASPIPCTTLYYFSANICLFLLGLPPGISSLSPSLKQALHNEASQRSALDLSFVYPFPGQRLAYLWCQLIPICWFFSLLYSSLLTPYLNHCIIKTELILFPPNMFLPPYPQWYHDLPYSQQESSSDLHNTGNDLRDCFLNSSTDGTYLESF